MGELTLTGLDEDVLSKLSSRAAAHGRSVGEEVAAVLVAEVVRMSPVTASGSDEDWWQKAAALRHQTDQLGVDMTELIREGRDER